MPIPYWVLALNYWLHLLAAVTWIGSLASIYFQILPASQRILKPVDQLALIENVRRRLEPIAWFCISLLVVTGLIQMSVNPNYNGFLSTSGQWSLAILAKHVLVVTLIAVSAAHTWDVLPAIRRALMQKDKIDSKKLAALQRREIFLLRTSLILAALVLLATAFARAASS